MWHRLYHSIVFRLAILTALTVLTTLLVVGGYWEWVGMAVLCGWYYARSIYRMYKRNAQKVSYLFDAIASNDYAFRYNTNGQDRYDKEVSDSLNRITSILFKVKSDIAEKERYFELILNSVNTGILVLNDKGYITQKNREALRLLGLNILTNVKQLSMVDNRLQQLIESSQSEEKHHITFVNERGTVNLSIRVATMHTNGKRIRIVALNDINSELEEKEIESWMRLTRVLTHEIMNSVTPITSLSDTLLSLQKEKDDEISNGLQVISDTGKRLIAFVDTYRKFTHIPAPEPSLFYLHKFLEQMKRLAYHTNDYPYISIETHVEPFELILYADEKLISQVVLNLVKNAMEAIGSERKDGRITLNAYCNPDESIIIEVSNNGPLIPEEEARHIFVPFFTTKEDGSGIGLSISRQIMQLSGGSISQRSNPRTGITTFVLQFP